MGSGLTALGETSLSYARYRVFDEAYFGTEFAKPYLFVNPRVGITYAPRSDFSVFTSLSYSSREPRLKALYDGEEAGTGSLPQFAFTGDQKVDLDAPFVKPEHVVDLEIGSTLRAEKVRAGATVFMMRFRDEIVPSGGLDQFGIPRTGNAARTMHAGIELEAEYRIGRVVDAFASATLSRNRFIEFDEYVYGSDTIERFTRDNNPIAGFPDHVANIGVTLHDQGFNASLSATYIGTQFVDNSGALVNDQSNVVDPHFLVNANFRYAFGGKMNGLRLSLDVNNVFDSEVLQFGNAGFGAPQFFPAATRNVFFGVMYRLES
jgi:iron complex outermembrane receptor protein